MPAPKPPTTLAEQVFNDPFKVIGVLLVLWGGYQTFVYRVEQLEKSVSVLSANTQTNNLAINQLQTILNSMDKKLDELKAERLHK